MNPSNNNDPVITSEPRSDAQRLMLRNLTVSVVALVLLIVTQVAPLRAAFFDNVLFRSVDEQAAVYVDEAFERALITFGLARATNAVISLMQGTELDVQPWGVGVTLSVGEVLDPINDMVERFSWVMLVSLVSLGIQEFLIEVSPWLSVQLLLALGLALIAVGPWLGRCLRYDPAAIGRRIIFVALVVRFAIPCVAYTNNQVYSYFLNDKYVQAKAEIEVGNRQLKELSSVSQELEESAVEVSSFEDDSFLARSKALFGQVKDTLDVERWRRLLEGRYEQAKDKSSEMIKSFLSLMVVFLLNTVLLPVGFLWGLLQLFRLMSGSAFKLRPTLGRHQVEGP